MLGLLDFTMQHFRTQFKKNEHDTRLTSTKGHGVLGVHHVWTNRGREEEIGLELLT